LINTHCCDFFPLNMHSGYLCALLQKNCDQFSSCKLKLSPGRQIQEPETKPFDFIFSQESWELRAWEERKDPVRAGETTFFYLMVRNTIVYIRISTVLVWLVKNPKLCSLSPGEVPSWRGQFWIQPPPAFDHLSSCFFPPFIYYPVGFIGNGFWYIKKMVGWGGVGWTGGGCLTFLARQYCTGLTRSHALKFFFPLEEEEINGIFF